jgi:hypothetical protein
MYRFPVRRTILDGTEFFFFHGDICNVENETLKAMLDEKVKQFSKLKLKELRT